MNPFATVLFPTGPFMPFVPLPQIARAIPILVLFTALGCESREVRPPVYPVKGSVLVAGQPPVRAVVVFHPLGAADPKVPKPTGEVAADGSFALSTYTDGDGAPAGEYVVTIVWPEGASTIGGDADTGGDRLGGRYANPQTTTLKARVDEGPTDLQPFRLSK